MTSAQVSELTTVEASAPDADPAPGSTGEEPRPQPRRVRVRPWIALVVCGIALFAAVFLAFEFGATSIVTARAQRELLRDFQDDVFAGTQSVKDWIPFPGQAVGIVAIPKLGVDTMIVEGTDPDLLKEGVGHFRNTVLPGQVGNAVLAGRRTTYAAPFGELDQLVKGDQITVTTGQASVTYTVVSVGFVQPGQPDVLGSTEDTRLTLVTSNPAYAPEERLVVVATTTLPPLPAAKARPTVLGPEESGMSGVPGALGPAILWFELLLAAIVVIWFLRRRGFSGRVLWLLGTPIVLVTLWLTLENADRLLPGTI